MHVFFWSLMEVQTVACTGRAPCGIRESWGLILNAWRYRRVAWSINIETGEASLDGEKQRQVATKDSPLKLEPLVYEISTAIVEILEVRVSSGTEIKSHRRGFNRCDTVWGIQYLIRSIAELRAMGHIVARNTNAYSRPAGISNCILLF